MEKITLKNLLLWSPKKLEATCDALRKEFMESFVAHLGFDPEDWDGGAPWGCPWDIGCDLEGETVEEMAKKHADTYREEILKLKAEQEENERDQEDEE